MRPRLIHPVVVVVSQISTAAQVLDATYQQPVGEPTRLTRTLSGQVVTKRSQPLTMGPGGADSIAASDGHVVFDARALTAAGVTLHVGDIITSEGGVTVRHRITRVEPHATYGGVHHHWYAFFTNEG